MLHITESTLTPGIPTPLEVLHVTDLHLLFSDERDNAYIQQHAASRTACFPHADQALEELKQELRRRAPDLLVLTGDILDFPSQANLDALHSLVENAPCPTLYVPGNHDWSLPQDYHSDAQYRTYMPLFDPFDGASPDFQLLELGGVRFAGIDDSRERMTPAQSAHLEEICADGVPVVACMHVPICEKQLEVRAKAVWHGANVLIGHEGSTAETRRFCDIASARCHAVLAGHVHFSDETRLPGGAVQLITALSAEGNIRRIRIE